MPAELTREVEPAPPAPQAAPGRLVAVLLCWLMPGQGLVRLGRSRLGWILFAAVLVVPVAAVLSPGLMLAAGVLAFGAALVPLFVERRPPPPRSTAWKQFFLRVAIAVVWSMTLQATWMGAYRIPAGSMVPTLEVGDQVLVAHHDRSPERGDVVVFEYPREPEKDFIKRVVGVAGDRIVVKDNVLFLNDQAVPRERIDGPCVLRDYDERLRRWEEKPCIAYTERLGDRSYRTIDATDDFDKDFPDAGEESPYVVPAGHVFVMGDNRNNSHDSRFWGAVPLDHIRGTALYVYSSKGPDGYRTERIGEWIR